MSLRCWRKPALTRRLGQLSGVKSAITSKLGHFSGVKSAVTCKAGHLSGVKPAVTSKIGQLSGVKPAVTCKLGHLSGVKPAVTRKLGHLSGVKSAVTRKVGHSCWYCCYSRQSDQNMYMTVIKRTSLKQNPQFIYFLSRSPLPGEQNMREGLVSLKSQFEQKAIIFQRPKVQALGKYFTKDIVTFMTLLGQLRHGSFWGSEKEPKKKKKKKEQKQKRNKIGR